MNSASFQLSKTVRFRTTVILIFFQASLAVGQSCTMQTLNHADIEPKIQARLWVVHIDVKNILYCFLCARLALKRSLKVVIDSEVSGLTQTTIKMISHRCKTYARLIFLRFRTRVILIFFQARLAHSQSCTMQTLNHADIEPKIQARLWVVHIDVKNILYCFLCARLALKRSLKVVIDSEVSGLTQTTIKMISHRCKTYARLIFLRFRTRVILIFFQARLAHSQSCTMQTLNHADIEPKIQARLWVVHIDVKNILYCFLCARLALKRSLKVVIDSEVSGLTQTTIKMISHRCKTYARLIFLRFRTRVILIFFQARLAHSQRRYLVRYVFSSSLADSVFSLRDV
ncbi:uncharacterized protein EV154DRAFT_488512 [Mucor mucedo]|uniref:uncharacterized protein n=1 Tax=Mucor mucedo TaxID=29922 RepID=UPI0022204A9D|nr:uncharacterized protein EV154DRAFT_488512 [Mucor mucedo]KAI7866675.1 hypothetical protein EV154DRAFT_488512 [Mucor mucedo]